MNHLNQLADSISGDLNYEELLDNLEESSNPRREELIAELRSCINNDCNRAAIILINALAIEELKELLLFYDPAILESTKHIKKHASTYQDLDDLDDYEVINGSHEIGLLDEYEKMCLQSIRSVRNRCAHGEDIELSDSNLRLAVNMITDIVVNKRDYAGITKETILDLVEKGMAPSEEIKAIPHFTKQDQFEICTELLKDDLELPRISLESRKNAIKRRGFTESQISSAETLDTIWNDIKGDLKSDVVETLSNRCYKKRSTSLKANFLNLRHFHKGLNKDRFNQILGKFLESLDTGDWNHQMDIGFTLSTIENFPQLEEKHVLDIWNASKAGTGYQKEETITFYSKIIQNLGEENRKFIINSIKQNISDAEDSLIEWSDDGELEIDEKFIMNELPQNRLNRYIDVFSQSEKREILTELKSSRLTELEDIKEVIEKLQ